MDCLAHLVWCHVYDYGAFLYFATALVLLQDMPVSFMIVSQAVMHGGHHRFSAVHPQQLCRRIEAVVATMQATANSVWPLQGALRAEHGVPPRLRGRPGPHHHLQPRLSQETQPMARSYRCSLGEFVVLQLMCGRHVVRGMVGVTMMMEHSAELCLCMWLKAAA